MTTTTTRTQEHELLTLDEAAALLRCGKSTIRRHIEAGRLPAYKLGEATSKLLFKRDELLALLRPEPPRQQLDPADLEPGERQATIEGVRRGLASTKARPWSEIAREMRHKYGLPE